MSVFGVILTTVSGAYQALRLCSFMSNPSIHTIQAQVSVRDRQRDGC